MRTIVMLAFAVMTVGDIHATDIVGTWPGESTCEAKGTACHDETVVYRFSKAQKPEAYSVSADKIVDGVLVAMGTLEFHYDESQHLLTCGYAQGVWKIKVNGEKMNGTLTRPDGCILRRVSLEKSPDSANDR